MPAPTQPIEHAAPTAPLAGAVAAAFDSLPIGVIAFDDALRVQYQNESACCILPDAADLAVALARDVVDSRFEDWQSHLLAAGSQLTSKRFDGLTFRTPAAQPRFVNLLLTTFSDPNDPPHRRGLLLLEDVTARITMEQRLAVSERLAAVGKLCASVAHELNNPLDGILRYLNLALRVADNSAASNLQDYIRAAREGCQRLVHIVRSLLDFSRNAPSALARQTLARLIDEAVRTFEARAAEQHISIFCRHPQADLPAVGGVNLYQVFCNLIKNAIDAMPSGGALAISAEERSGEIVITFTDSGTGLPSDADRLFQPFFTTKPPGQGTGLGLAVCKEIVERLGGAIAGANRTDGRGAIFTVRVPSGLTHPPRSAEKRPAPVTSAATIQGDVR